MGKIKGPAIFGISLVGIFILILLINLAIRINDNINVIFDFLFGWLWDLLNITSVGWQNFIAIVILLVILWLLGVSIKKIVDNF